MSADTPPAIELQLVERLADLLGRHHAEAILPALLTVLHPHLALLPRPVGERVFVDVRLLTLVATLLDKVGHDVLLLHVIDLVTPHLAQPGDIARPLPATALGMSPRELDVLRGAARGLTNATIARQFHLSEDTVKTHMRRLLRKLGVPDRASAVARGYDLGVLVPIPLGEAA